MTIKQLDQALRVEERTKTIFTLDSEYQNLTDLEKIKLLIKLKDWSLKELSILEKRTKWKNI